MASTNVQSSRSEGMRPLDVSAISQQGASRLDDSTSRSFSQPSQPASYNSEATALGLNMSSKACILLFESMGSDLSRIIHELKKLSSYLGNNNNVTAEVIEKVTGFSREFNNFELIKALASKNLTKSYRIAKSMGDNPKRNPIIVTISILFSNFSKSLVYSDIEDKNPKNISAKLKISEYALRDIALINQNYSRHKLIRIIGYLRDADGQAKGMSGPNLKDGTILNELLFKILY